jgi:hypothetical protein
MSAIETGREQATGGLCQVRSQRLCQIRSQQMGLHRFVESSLMPDAASADWPA